MCCLCNYTCKWLDVQVFSDEDNKPAGPVSCIFSVTWLAGDVKEPTHLSKTVGHEVPGILVRHWFSVLYFMGWLLNKGCMACLRLSLLD